MFFKQLIEFMFKSITRDSMQTGLFREQHVKGEKHTKVEQQDGGVGWSEVPAFESMCFSVNKSIIFWWDNLFFLGQNLEISA